MQEKKYLRHNKTTSGYYTFEEVYEMYKNNVYKLASKCYMKINQTLDDAIQMINIMLWRAYKDYDNPEVGFAYYANIIIDSGIKKAIKRQNAMKRSIDSDKIIHIDTLVYTDNNNPLSFHEYIKDESQESMFDFVLTKIVLKQCIKNIPKRNRHIFLEYACGKKQSIIAKKYGISQIQVSRIIKNTRNKLKEMVS
jgi:RNA polymerase sigma factor (sigma-70 family)